MVKAVVKEGLSVPSVANATTTAIAAQMSLNASIAPVATQPSVRTAPSGYWRKKYNR